MTAYLQRLFDRSTGSLAVAAPALRPGSPLARFDQRLSLAELADDFTFGAPVEPATPPREEFDLSLPAPMPALPPHRRRPGAVVQGSEFSEPSNREALQEAPAPGRRRKSKKGNPDKDARFETQPPTDKLASISSAPRPIPAGIQTVTPLPERRSPEQRLAAAQQPAAAPVSEHRREPLLDERELSPTPSPRRATSRLRAAEPTARSPEIGAPHPQAPVQRVEPIRAEAEVGPVRPEARPAERHARELGFQPIAKEAPPIDWAEVDRRIDRALSNTSERGQRLTTPPLRGGTADPEKQDTPAERTFVTAAQASVIGAIEHSPRHRMLFGARWR